MTPYNSKAMSDIQNECRMNEEYAQAEIAAAHNHPALRRPHLTSEERHAILQPIHVATHSHRQANRRNKRCVLAYLNHRIDKLRALWWDTGSVLPEELKQVLSGEELAFFSAYDELLTSHITALDLQLTELQTPPKDLYVEVRTLGDVGSIQTESGGQVNLEANTMHLLKRTDAETMIRQGQLLQTRKE